jgi:hypothetical protein
LPIANCHFANSLIANRPAPVTYEAIRMIAQSSGEPAYLTLAEAAKLVPGPPVYASTVMRWILRGVRLPDKSRLYLRATRRGSRWLVTKEGLAEFFELHTKTFVPVTPPRTAGEQNRAVDRAVAELERMGA